MEFSPSVVTVLTLIGGILTTLILSAAQVIIAKLNKNTALTEQNTAITVKTAADVEKNTALTEATASELTKVQGQTVAIAANVDGLKSKADTRIAEQDREIAWLKQILAERKEIAALLAQHAAASHPGAPATSPLAADAADGILDAIATNTVRTQAAIEVAKEEARAIGEATLAGVHEIAAHGTSVAREVLDVVKANEPPAAAAAEVLGEIAANTADTAAGVKALKPDTPDREGPTP